MIMCDLMRRLCMIFQSALAPSLHSADGKKAHSAIVEPTRMSQLETLEAKMASIEVSLANVTAAAAAPRRMKRNGLVGTARSLHSSHLGVVNGPSREIHKEMDFLRQSLKDKENLILK